MSSVTPLAAALIGAGGAVFGGILTVSGQLLIEHARAKRERQSDERRERRELQLAIRLVMEELAESEALIRKAAKERRYWVGPRQLPTQTWNDYRTSLAAAIETALAWRSITSAYDAINDLNWLVHHRRSTSTTVDGITLGFPLEPEDGTRQTWRSIRLAIQTLERTLGVEGPASRLMREQEDIEAECWPYGDEEDFDRSARV